MYFHFLEYTHISCNSKGNWAFKKKQSYCQLVLKLNWNFCLHFVCVLLNLISTIFDSTKSTCKSWLLNKKTSINVIGHSSWTRDLNLVPCITGLGIIQIRVRGLVPCSGKSCWEIAWCLPSSYVPALEVGGLEKEADICRRADAWGKDTGSCPAWQVFLFGILVWRAAQISITTFHRCTHALFIN